MPNCEVSGIDFEVSEFEQTQRQKVGVPSPTRLPKFTFRHLGAFWPHFTLHTRECDLTGKTIISPFGEHCPYPVWNREEWFRKTDPPSAELDLQKPFFDQAWELFQKCPIPHTYNMGNENCEFADDWLYSRNCYLCHSGVESEDCNYCFRLVKLTNCQFCVFSFDSELCVDITNCSNCYNLKYCIRCRNCHDADFLFDCRNCSDCLFCWNLRNKQYCIANKQLTKEEFTAEKAKFDLSSRKNYELAKKRFQKMILEQAWWRATEVEKCENSFGDFLESCKGCHNCFFFDQSEDCINCMRGGAKTKDSVDCIDVVMDAELCHTTLAAVDKVYKVNYSFNIIRCRFLEYCAFCQNCEHCFACCGLVGKKYHILNKEYSPEEYENKVKQIQEKMQAEGDTGKFFPPYFSPCPYEETFSYVYWPLAREEQKKYGFRLQEYREKKQKEYLPITKIPDKSTDATEEICKEYFWDPKSKHPFQITKADLAFAKQQKAPLPNCFYVQRIKDNFSWLFFDGELRQTICAVTGERVYTTLPTKLDGRILSEQAYLEKIV